MTRSLCPGQSPFDFGDPCVRASWSAFLPAAFVFALCIFSIPLPASVRRLFDPITRYFVPFLTLSEAEALDEQSSGGDKHSEEEEHDSPTVPVAQSLPLWRTVVFAFVGVVETLWHLGYGCYLLYKEPQNLWKGGRALCFSVAWLYTVVRPVAHPTPTPPFDVFGIYVCLSVATILELTGYLFDHHVYGIPLPSGLVLSGFGITLLACILVLAVIFGMPLAIPSDRVKREDIGRTRTTEDYATLMQWLTFSWIHPLVKKGRNATLQEEDVWNLSPSFQSRPVFIKFSQIQRPSLLRRLWAANSLDLILDFILASISVMFNYASPFFLKRILDEIDDQNVSAERRSKAYIYAFLAFACTIGKAQADLQHLWFGRRAATRMRSELMAAIYDKALKRKDYSGIVDKNKIRQEEEAKAAEAKSSKKKKSKAEVKAEKEKAATKDDPRAGADTGKIVNLMAGDANRICQMATGLYFIYMNPFEIAIATVFLYQLLGWSAFAGFFVLVIYWPLNTFLGRRSVRIQKGVLASRDKRMGVLNELIGAVKFIKFFAWEDRWIERALQARSDELKWMVKARTNSVMFYLLWSSAPILVSITAFFVYVMQGNKLTISTAFTAITLFNMLRLPLNILPQWIIQILQTGVAIKRISVYLDEEEVSEQVSSLKKDASPPFAGNHLEEGLGFDNATFKWNEVPLDKEEDNAKDNGKGRSQDVSTDSSSIVDDTSSTVSGHTSVSEVDFTALDEERRFELKDLSLRFPEGQLTVVTGPTASGKTALLMALLGEMTIVSGKLVMRKEPSSVDANGFMHSISYAAQTPWLRHQSIKDNILFGYPFDEERYKAVVEACALNPDLAVLEDGDQTEIGARGVSLSGGQKARVALARAVYARTKYVLLDDPLSAVDSHTSRFLYEHLLRGPLLANRTVILVTHHVELVLPGAHYLVRMLDGRIDTHGTIKELHAQGILEHIAQDAEVEVQKEVAKEKAVDPEEVAVSGEDGGVQGSDAEAKKPRKLIKDEHREVGGVKWKIYKSYLKASSYWTWAALLFLIAVAQLLGLGEKIWVMIWGDAYDKTGTVSQYPYKAFTAFDHEVPSDGFSNSHYQHAYRVMQTSFEGRNTSWPDALSHPYFYVGIYAAIGFASALTSVLSVTAQYTGALRASRILFKKLLVTVMRATFRFHDTTPQGRMLNRFGKDIETIDTSLAGSLQAVNSSLAGFFVSVLTIAFVFPIFLIPALIIGFGYYELAIGYLNTGRDLRRMESNTRSPIFSDFGELLDGIVTVRAFSAENRFLRNLHKKVDVTTKMWYSFWMTNRWLLVHFDFLSGIAVLVTSLFAIALLTNGAGVAAITITSAMSFTQSVYWACRFWTALELDLNSVERVVEYLDLPQEPPAIIESNRVPAYWPSSASNESLVSVENLTIRYAPELPAVLHDVSFSLKAGERVGLLGRTGSGKSTLAMSILRFVDPAAGKIVIDGIDISTIGIQDLRSRLTFIPQDATLFSGTLRDNLDPFNEHTDAECLDVLHRVQMINGASGTTSRNQSGTSTPRPPSVHDMQVSTPVIGSDNGSSIITSASSPTEVDGVKNKITLDTRISAGGTNFSQGQRQLIAMARALLRRSSIIVLDEATSSIDFSTDAKIQQTIREEFTESLLLTVAHRLRTVIDYDRLIVLDKGQISEFDTPWNLIQKEDGIFRNMCLKSGSFTELETIAKAKASSISV